MTACGAETMSFHSAPKNGRAAAHHGSLHDRLIFETACGFYLNSEF
jgi:hypothetical protein